MRGFIYIVVAVLSFSCSTTPDCEIDSSNTRVSIQRLDKVLFSLKSVDEVGDFLTKHPTLTMEFLGAYQYPNQSFVANELWKRVQHSSMDTLLMEVEERFGDMSDLEQEFSDLFARIQAYYPDFTPPKIQTMVTGFGSSELYITDSLIIIGLEYYTGDGSSYRPLNVPAYILERYDKSYIVPTTALLLANDFIEEDPSDNTLIADMVYYGKKYYFANEVLPCTPDGMLIWYSDEEMKDVNENQHIIWAHFIENKLLFATSHLVKKKYLDERPTTFEIGNKCPGRIAAWVGWEIVNSYMDNNKLSMQELMMQKDAGLIFESSEYKTAVPGIL
jgi:hypothetical protein